MGNAMVACKVPVASCNYADQTFANAMSCYLRAITIRAFHKGPYRFLLFIGQRKFTFSRPLFAVVRYFHVIWLLDISVIARKNASAHLGRP